MSLYNKASLIQVPSLYKDGLLVSTVPEDRSGDFTVARGSNLSATRIGEDGYIKKGYENLLLQSNQFDTTWLQTDCAATSGQIGYDGSSDAWLLSKSAANGRLRQYITDTGVQTLSAYFKAGTNNWMRITYGGVTTYFDLANGVLGSDNSINSTITSVGSGWYRCTFTANVTSAQYAQFYVADANGVISGTSGSIYIQDAQLNQGLVAYPYLETTTVPAQGGLLENTPRLDWSNGVPAVKLEEERTNLITSSEDFTSNIWSGGATATNNATISPEGVTNAALLVDSTLSATLSYRRITNTGATTIGATYTLSVYVKPKGSSRSFKFWARNTDAPATFFDLVDGTTSEPSSSTITSVGNGWFRVSSTGSLVSGTLAAYLYVYTNADNVDGFYVYGLQVEQASTPSSYIPTYGTSQTRSNETVSDTFSIPTTATIYNSFYAPASEQVYILDQVFSVSEGLNKVAIAFSPTAVKISVGGAIVASSTGSYDTTSLTSISLGSDSGADYSNAPISGFYIFPEFLTDDELNSLTA